MTSDDRRPKPGFARHNGKEIPHEEHPSNGGPMPVQNMPKNPLPKSRRGEEMRPQRANEAR